MSKFEDMINTIQLGNCYELIKDIPDKSIDLVVIDPPYEIETEGGNTNIGKNLKNNMLKELNDLKITEGIDYSLLEQYIRIMKKINIYIWCNKKQILEYLKFFVEKHNCSFEIMTWCKTNPTPLCGGNYLIDKEFCLYFRKGVKLNTTFETAFTYWILPKNIYDKETYLHPTIKPLSIIKKLIINSSNVGGVVLDTFSGSGTTCLACKELRRNYIGMEIDPKYHKISVDRLNGITAQGQTSIFTDFEKIGVDNE